MFLLTPGMFPEFLQRRDGFRIGKMVLDRIKGDVFQEHLLNTSYKFFKNIIFHIKE